jgi:thioredoxin 1
MLTGGVIGLLLFMTASQGEVKFDKSERVIEVASQEQMDDIMKKNEVTLVDFNADWCGPCQVLKPVIHEIAEQYKDRVAVLSVNVDQNAEIAGKAGVRGIPDVRIYKNGKEVEQVVGVRSKEDYVKMLDKVLAVKQGEGVK